MTMPQLPDDAAALEDAVALITAVRAADEEGIAVLRASGGDPWMTATVLAGWLAAYLGAFGDWDEFTDAWRRQVGL